MTLNLQNIQSQIRALELKYQRTPGSVTLLAVSKFHTVAEMRQVIRAGQKHFGESYTQEAVVKIVTLNNPELVWHFIGPIQSNKTRLIAQHFHWVHSVDREKTAQRLNDHRQSVGRALDVCIQVNTSGEDTKSGILPEQLHEFAAHFDQWPLLRLRGLMALPAPSDDFEEQRRQHHALRRLFDVLNQDGYKLDTLSMGTSDDMEAAIAEGATIVRIGTALFGPRHE